MANLVLFRKEYKYFINYIDYLIIKNKIKNFLKVDQYCNNNNFYNVRSLYFDNKSNNCYYEKISGIENREKYRIRIYNLKEDPIRFEIKSKINNTIIKNFIIINSSDIKKIFNSDYTCLLNYKNPIASKIFYKFSRDFFKPVVIIDYKREAYYYNIDNDIIRITFDMELKKNETNLFDLFINNIKMDNVFSVRHKIIMEIKYKNFILLWLKKLLQLERFERCAISKYTLSRYIEQ